jgi:ribosomal protein L15
MHRELVEVLDLEEERLLEEVITLDYYTITAQYHYQGHKGQKARSGGKINPGFEGGQTPMWKTVRKYGFTNAMWVFRLSTLHLLILVRFKKEYDTINLDRLKYFIRKKRIDITKPITIKTLRDAGAFRKVKQGVKLLARVSSLFKELHFVLKIDKGSKGWNIPIHIEVTECSRAAQVAVENAGMSSLKELRKSTISSRRYSN